MTTRCGSILDVDQLPPRLREWSGCSEEHANATEVFTVRDRDDSKTWWEFRWNEKRAGWELEGEYEF